MEKAVRSMRGVVDNGQSVIESLFGEGRSLLVQKANGKTLILEGGLFIDTIIPRYVFKFRPINDRAVDILRQKELWFSRPESFNDPFDCQMECTRFIESALNEIDKRKGINAGDITRFVDNAIRHAGICSFSKAKKNQLMWAHYADNHRGFCIGFKGALVDEVDEFVGAHHVKYQEKHPYQRIDDIIASRQHVEEVIALDILRLALSIKYTHWQYEREWRIIRGTSGPVRFRPETVSSVTFGLKTTQEAKSRVIDALSSTCWSHVRFFQARKADDRFALEFDECGA